jgi:hypothetical protein
MSAYVRIKEYIINLQSVCSVRVTDDVIEFALISASGAPPMIRFERGKDLQEGEFDQVREFVYDLVDPDRVIAV